jgi:hypothetical protein
MNKQTCGKIIEDYMVWILKTGWRENQETYDLVMNYYIEKIINRGQQVNRAGSILLISHYVDTLIKEFKVKKSGMFAYEVIVPFKDIKIYFKSSWNKFVFHDNRETHDVLKRGWGIHINGIKAVVCFYKAKQYVEDKIKYLVYGIRPIENKYMSDVESTVGRIIEHYEINLRGNKLLVKVSKKGDVSQRLNDLIQALAMIRDTESKTKLKVRR